MSCISVIVPAFNVEKYIIEAIDSVLAQTVVPHEIIVIDDGSTDGTWNKLLTYSANPVVKLYQTINQGQGPARNFGREIATSKYIYYFDADDRLEENFVEKMEQFIAEYNAPDLIFFSGISFFDEENVVQNDSTQNPYARNFFKYYPEGERSLFRDLVINSIFSPSPCLYISKKGLWLNNKLNFKPMIHEDMEVIFPLIASSSNALVTDEILFHRRIRSGSTMTSKPTIKRVNGCRDLVISLIYFMENNPKPAVMEKSLLLDKIQQFMHMYISVAAEAKERLDCLLAFRAAYVVKRIGFFRFIVSSMLHNFLIIRKS